jgi:2Fe-2S ferredoxin
MPAITYVLPDGREEIVEVPVGQSVMDGSVRNNLPGIVAECGGGCSCATCHVYIDPTTAEFFDEPLSEETDLVEYLEGACERSRLACQLIVSDACAGVRVVVPATNG